VDGGQELDGGQRVELDGRQDAKLEVDGGPEVELERLVMITNQIIILVDYTIVGIF
jgi:hypothetical protein